MTDGEEDSDSVEEGEVWRKRAPTSSFPPTRLTVCLFVVVVVCLFGW